MPTAVITGASRGLGHALARALAARGWSLILDARNGRALDRAVDRLGAVTDVTAIAGDVADPAHRAAVAAAVPDRLELLVHNASALGPSPLPPLAMLDPAEFGSILRTNVVAPLALTQELLPALRAAEGTVLAISSDAAVEPYPGWGGYGASKAALDQLTAVLGAEHPELAVHAVDPGDMRTAMHQAAFPGEDISDRPEPASVVPALLHLIDERPPSGRYRASDLLVVGAM
ncbi:SDR family NAD(P)-dependent oxidoreductase [Nitriliruptor alkaliphilus]|uniref:SDR family NAD(P)-dependent oxidoreductase n=1 Tax=Nitriliruptor alkaliphilus TaxID=427918 RepID=UPI0006971358|nr:SDR family oxidoreductase [Nitriliruptor alkaliphilus]